MPVAKNEGGTQHWYHQDHLSSTVAMSDATGVLARKTEYEAFGQEIASTGAAANLRGYGSHWRDDESGLVYMGARYYDPALVRFTQPDSVVPEPDDPQSWNRYSYTRNSPVNGVDPTGHFDIGAALAGELAARTGGHQGAAGFFGSVLTGTIPIAGEIADVGVIFSLDPQVGTGERLLATGSLVANVGTLGFAPNFGTVAKHADELIEAGQDLSSGLVKHGDETADGFAGGICFAAGTPVETRDGLVAIEDVEVGNVVLSRDPETGETAWRPVARTFVTPDQAVLRLELIAEGGSTESLRVTGEHPFWVSEQGWVAAQELQPGAQVLASSGGWLRVGGGTWQPTRETVYNFEVDEFHTYFVGTGGAWVHNTCQAKPPTKSVQEAGEDLAAEIGRNRVSARTAGGKQVDIDLAGKAHFEKSLGEKVPTPHVKESTVNVGPNGKTNLSESKVRPATMDDIRTARKIVEREQ